MKREINYARFKITFWRKIKNKKDLVTTDVMYEGSVIGADLEEMNKIDKKLGIRGRLRETIESHPHEKYKISDFEIINRQGYTTYEINL